MTATAAAAPERLPFRTKFFFGIGGAAETIALYAIANYILLYYNQILGVNPAWVGLAMSVGLVLDGITEPMVGSWSDRTTSRLGRRHPWMFAAPFPIALAFYAMFNPPDGLSKLGLAVWAGVTVSIVRLAMAFFHTPHLALGGELSPHYTERSKVMAYNSFALWAGGASLQWIALSYFFKKTPEYPRGVLNPEPWPAFALTFAIAIVAILFTSAWFTRDRIPMLPKPAADLPKFSVVEFGKDIGKALRNVNYVWLLVGYFFLALMLGIREHLRLYTYTFYWGLTSEQFRMLVFGSLVGYGLTFTLVARLHRRFDKKRVIILGALAYAVVPAIPLVLGQLGVLKPGMPNLLWILIGFYAVATCAISVLQVSVASALADIADQNDLKYGLRQEGILYSTRALSAKIDQAIGSAMAGFVLAWIAFPEKAKPGHVDPDVLNNLALWDGALSAVPGVIAAFCYGRYRINQASYESTREALARRNAEVRAAATATADGDVLASPAPAA